MLTLLVSTFAIYLLIVEHYWHFLWVWGFNLDRNNCSPSQNFVKQNQFIWPFTKSLSDLLTAGTSLIFDTLRMHKNFTHKTFIDSLPNIPFLGFLLYEICTFYQLLLACKILYFYIFFLDFKKKKIRFGWKKFYFV